MLGDLSVRATRKESTTGKVTPQHYSMACKWDRKGYLAEFKEFIHLAHEPLIINGYSRQILSQRRDASHNQGKQERP